MTDTWPGLPDVGQDPWDEDLNAALTWLHNNAGVPGPAGPVGPAGAAGAAGAKGDTGAAGPQGDRGAIGAQGPQGEDGVAGPKGDTGTAGATGAAGATGPKGDKGDTGTAGSTGPAGPAGTPGVPNGGFTGQALLKTSNANGAVGWGDASPWIPANQIVSIFMASDEAAYKVQGTEKGAFFVLQNPGTTTTVEMTKYPTNGSFENADSFVFANATGGSVTFIPEQTDAANELFTTQLVLPQHGVATVVRYGNDWWIY